MASSSKPAPRRTAPSNVHAPVPPFDRHYNDGIHHLDRHRLPEAIAAFEAALAANPPPHRQAAVLFALATAARRLGQTRAAEDLYNRVLTIEPGRREALVNLSNLYRESGKLRDAQIMLGNALEADPGASELWLSLGHVVRAGGDLERARTFFCEAVRLRPGYAQALGSLADLLVDFGQSAAALDHYTAALRKEPHNARLRLHRGLVLLSEGRCAEGWRDYAWRFKAAEKPLRYKHDLKPWDGRALAGRGLLIAAEQGLGDQMIFASLFAGAAARAGAGTVFIECEPRLVPLFARSFPQCAVHPSQLRDTGGAIDAHYPWLPRAGMGAAIAMGDLPGLLQEPALPAESAPFAYLRPAPKDYAAFRSWLAQLGPGPYIGLCWRSGKLGGQRALQFCELSHWGALLARLPGTVLCLQYDASGEELAILAQAGRALHVPPALDQKNEIDRMAGLVAALDLVVTAPTAISALSAAVGTTTLKLLYDRSWTALGHPFEPLAPACRHVRPDRPGDWTQVFARAHDFIRTLV